MRRCLPRFSAVVMVAATVGIVGCGGQADGVATEAAEMSSGQSLSAMAIIAIAQRAATDAGESKPTEIEWVASTRSEAATVTSGSAVTGPQDDQPVILIQLQGAFTATHARMPRAATSEQDAQSQLPTGSVITLVVDGATGDVLDYGLTNEHVNLGKLGQVHTSTEG